MPIQVIAELVPKTPNYALIDDTNLRGGYQSVATQADMEAIATDKRKVGMQVFVQSDFLTYTLQPDLLTWTVPQAPSATGYVHNQIISSNNWIISHGLDKYPSVTVVDTLGRIIQGDVQYVDLNHVVVSFTGQFSGQAFLN